MTEDEKVLMMNRMKEALPVMRKSLKLSQSDLACEKLFDAFDINLERLNEYFIENK